MTKSQKHHPLTHSPTWIQEMLAHLKTSMFLLVSQYVMSQDWAVTGDRKWVKCPPNVNQLLAVWKIWGAVSCNNKKVLSKLKRALFSNQGVSCSKSELNSSFHFSALCTELTGWNSIEWSPKLISQKHKYPKTNNQIGLCLRAF